SELASGSYLRGLLALVLLSQLPFLRVDKGSQRNRHPIPSRGVRTLVPHHPHHVLNRGQLSPVLTQTRRDLCRRFNHHLPRPPRTRTGSTSRHFRPRKRTEEIIPRA